MKKQNEPIGLKAVLEELNRRNAPLDIKAFAKKRMAQPKRGLSLALLDYLRGVQKSLRKMKPVAVCAALALAVQSAFASGTDSSQVQTFGDYQTYASQSGLVTTVQKEEAAQHAQAADLFRRMSLADRWDDSGPGSFSDRWNPSAYGSIERRWAQ